VFLKKLDHERRHARLGSNNTQTYKNFIETSSKLAFRVVKSNIKKAREQDPSNTQTHKKFIETSSKLAFRVVKSNIKIACEQDPPAQVPEL
jgi:UDP-glucose 4-epimerase